MAQQIRDLDHGRSGDSRSDDDARIRKVARRRDPHGVDHPVCGAAVLHGWRIMAPALAGHIVRQGGRIASRVQPGLEGTVLLLLLAALLTTAWPGDIAAPLGGLALTIASVVVAIRLARWRLWRCTDRPDLLTLALGYGWLAAGMGLLGLSGLGVVSDSAAIHALTIGGLGTLTLTVMSRTRLLYRFRDANIVPVVHLAALLMSAAALVRISWTGTPFGAALLLVSAGLWSTACLIVLYTLLRTLPEGRGLASGGDRPADTSVGTV